MNKEVNVLKELAEFDNVNELIFNLMEYSVYLKESFGLNMCKYGNYKDIEIKSYEENYGMIFEICFDKIEVKAWEDNPNKFSLKFTNCDMDFVADVINFTDKWMIDNQIK